MKRNLAAIVQESDEASPQGWLSSFLGCRFSACGRVDLKRGVLSVVSMALMLVCSVSALLASREVPAAEFAVPKADEFAASAVLFRDAGPGFSGRSTVDVLVHADMVVERAKLDQTADDKRMFMVLATPSAVGFPVCLR